MGLAHAHLKSRLGKNASQQSPIMTFRRRPCYGRREECPSAHPRQIKANLSHFPPLSLQLPRKPHRISTRTPMGSGAPCGTPRSTMTGPLGGQRRLIKLPEALPLTPDAQGQPSAASKHSGERRAGLEQTVFPVEGGIVEEMYPFPKGHDGNKGQR